MPIELLLIVTKVAFSDGIIPPSGFVEVHAQPGVDNILDRISFEARTENAPRVGDTLRVTIEVIK